MFTSRLHLCLGLALVLAPPAAAADHPTGLSSYFKVCSRSDPKLNECVVDSLNGARDRMMKGLPSLGLEPLEAVFLREVHIEEGPAEFQLRLVLRNTTMRGLVAFAATRAKVDIPGRYIEVETLVPQLVLAGRYSFGGQILTLPIHGNGPFDVVLGDVNVTSRIRFADEASGAALHWKAAEYLWDMQMAQLKVNFRSLFGGNKRLGQYANAYINRHWQPIYQIYKHLVTANFGVVFKDITNGMLAKVPFDEMFKP